MRPKVRKKSKKLAHMSPLVAPRPFAPAASAGYANPYLGSLWSSDMSETGPNYPYEL